MHRPGKIEATGVVILTMRYILRSSPAEENRGHRSRRSDNALHTLVRALNHVFRHRRFLALLGQKFEEQHGDFTFFIFHFNIIIRM
jgi:hypothetical protein